MKGWNMKRLGLKKMRVGAYLNSWASTGILCVVNLEIFQIDLLQYLNWK